MTNEEFDSDGLGKYCKRYEIFEKNPFFFSYITKNVQFSPKFPKRGAEKPLLPVPRNYCNKII